MLRINQNSSLAGAKSYYSTADYYTEGQELSGSWRGKGAEQVGLTGSIAKSDWDRLCDGLNPRSGERLMQRLKSNRTICYDFNFHVPKSVSLLYAHSKDERIVDAFRDAVDATLHDIEAEMQTRVRKNGKNEDRTTGSMVCGEFVHFTARPVDGVPDPHLHLHAVIFNTTLDENEQKWKAGQFRNLKRDAPYFEAVYHSRLAHNLSQLGLPIERNAKGWELAGLSPELLKKFSRRATEIERKAEELGIDSPEAKAELGAKTRSRKEKHLSMPELQLQWRSRMTDPELASLIKLADRMGDDEAPREIGAARQAVAYAIAHEFERASVVPERTLLATALKRAAGAATLHEVVESLQEANLIRGNRDGRAWATTAEVLDEEREIVAFARDGRGRCKPLVSGSYAIQRDWLNASQRSAVRHILESRDRVMAIRGVAGVGKTSLMSEAVVAIEANGTKVIAVAPSAAASRVVQRNAGFSEADTVARLLLDKQLQEKARGQVIWVDEASLLGTGTLRDLFRQADSLDARILLTGDRYQHGSVARGAALRLLEEEAGIIPAEVKEIQRQTGIYKAAVKALSEQRVSEAFHMLDGLGWIREIPDDERYKSLAADYAQAVREKKTALIVSPSHHEGRTIDRELRQLLKQQGTLQGEERGFKTLVNAQLTEAEKTNLANYQPGDVIQFHQNAKGFMKGQRLTAGEQPLPYELSHRYTAFRPSHIRLAKGDVIRVTHNGRTADGKHRLDNGATFTVKGFDRAGNIVLTNGWIIGKGFGFLAYGYTVTSHASQSRSVDCVFIGQSSMSAAAASREQFYVSASRGKRLTIYTDDKAVLLEAVQQRDERVTATEFAGRDQQRQRVGRFEGLREDRHVADRTPQQEFAHAR